MTLKTLTGPSIREALADARRLFGAGVVLLQSSPAAHGQPATVTVGFDAPPPPRHLATPPRPAPPAAPEPGAGLAPRAYGYGATRKMSLPVTEEVSAAAPPPPAPVSPSPTPFSVPALAAPAPVAEPAPPVASATEVDRLRERLAEVEGLLAGLRRAAPAPRPARPAMVFVGPAGGGKTSLALRLAAAPALLDATSTAAILVAPTHDRFVDAAPLFWAAGVPVAVVRTAEEMADALRLFEGADRLVVDTPALPLQPERARPLVARLGALLAPLGAVEVHLAVDATRAAATLTAGRLAATGLRPDALALTRLDEVGDPGCGAPEAAWSAALALPLRWTATGPEAADLARAADPAPAEHAGEGREACDASQGWTPERPAAALPAWGPIPLARPAPPPRVPDFRTLAAAPLSTAPAAALLV